MSGLHELPDDAAAASTAKGWPAGKKVLARTIEKGLVSPCAFLLKCTLAPKLIVILCPDLGAQYTATPSAMT
jgi:hypothetical protein